MRRLLIVIGELHSYHDLPRIGEISLGRAPSNTIPLDDEGVSRHHCVFITKGETITVKDLQSFNGTFLNGAPVTEHEVKSWDKVQIGGASIFVVTTHTGESASEQRKLEQFEALFEINKAINSVLDRGKLLEKIMDHAISLCDAQRGFVIIRDQETGKLHYEVARNIDKSEIFTPEFATSSHIIARVLETGEPVLTSDARSDFGEFLSIVDLNLRCLLCIPLKNKGRILGTVYLDNRCDASAFNEADLQVLSAFADQAAIAIENAELLEKAKKKERQDQELRIASSIQRDLMPRTTPKFRGLQVCGQTIPAREVGGDYFDFVVNGDRIYLCIGDVSGKGLPAGLIMVMLRSLLRPLVDSHRDTSTIIRKINHHLTRDLKKEMFVSFLLMMWDQVKQKLTYTGAGHERLLIYDSKIGRTRVQKVGGLVLGVLPELDAMLREVTLDIEVGDTVLVYTDGVTEALNKEGKAFEVDGLRRLLDLNGSLPLKRLKDLIFENIVDHQSGMKQQDDMTVLLLRRGPEVDRVELGRS